MKKSFLAVAVILGTSSAFAQDLTNKKGEGYLPEAGDWGIGVDATPFLNYFGNFIGGNGTNSAPTWNFLTTNQTIFGKYYTAEDMAYRGAIRLGFGSAKGSEMEADRLSTVATNYPGAVPATVENSWKTGTTNIGLSGGIEMRKGKGRLQGFYGAELGINLMSSKSEFTYGNALTQTSSASANNVDIAAADEMFDHSGASLGNLNENDPFGNQARVLSTKSGMMFGLGLRGFIGAEYFIMPKLAIGGEFGWGLAFMSLGTSTMEIESEGIDNTPAERTATFTTETNNGSRFGLDTDNMNSVFGPAGSLKVTFHF